jgi:hypothetical protein
VPGVIDGRRWLRQRIQVLEAELAAGPSEPERTVLEAELQQAKAELHRRGRWRVWLWGAKP